MEQSGSRPDPTADAPDGRPTRAPRAVRLPGLIRPVVFAALALVTLASAPIAIEDAVDAIRSEHALERGSLCGQSPDPCLTRVQGVLSGPIGSHRSVLKEWLLRVDDRDVDAFEVGPRISDRIAELDVSRIEASLYDGDVVAVADPAAAQIRTLDVGLRGAAFAVALTICALALAAGLARFARKQKVASGSWLRAPRDGSVDPADPLVAVPGVFGVFALLAMLFGASWVLAAILGTGASFAAAVMAR